MPTTKALKFHSIAPGNFRDGRTMLVVKFHDEDLNVYHWVPAWSQVDQLFRKSVNTEKLNKPTSSFVKDFAETARQVFQEANAEIENAEVLSGWFSTYKTGMLNIRYEALAAPDVFGTFFGPRAGTAPEKRVYERSLPPAFPVTADFLRDWLGRPVKCFMVNGVLVELEGKDAIKGHYPPRGGDEDLPF